LDSGLESGGRMKTVIFLTVPRTGTGFFLNLLKPHFNLIGMSDAAQGLGGLVISHISLAAVDSIDDIRNPIIITTWRDWRRVQNSFINYKDSLDLLDKHIEAWKVLILRFAPLILTVEDEYGGFSKEERLAALGRKLDINFETDWKPVNEWKET